MSTRETASGHVLTFDDLPALARAAVPEHSTAFSPELALWRERMPGGYHWSGLVRRGNSLRITTLGPQANVSALFYNFEDRAERYNMPDTLKSQSTAYICKGLVPCAKSLDTVSVFGNCTDDVRRVLAVAAGYDPADAFSVDMRMRSEAVTAPVFGVIDATDEHFLGDEQAKAAYARGVERIKILGYRVETIDFRPFKEISDMTYFGPSMAERTAVLGDFIHSHPQAQYTAVVRNAIMKAAEFSAVDAFKMLHRVKELERQIDLEVWSQVDLLCVPTAPTIHTREAVSHDPAYGSTSLGAYTNFAPFLGMPAVSVPNGFRPDGLPTGIMFVARRADDVQLLHYAQSFSAS